MFTALPHSPFHRCARKISRFARNDDAGKALLSFPTCLKRFSLLLSYRQCPIHPFGAPSPRGKGFGCGGGDTLIFRLLETLFPLAFIPPVPYPPLRGTFPSKGRLFMTNGEAPPSFLIRESFHRKPWTTTPMISFYFFSQYATSVSAAPMPRAVLMPMPVYMAKEARVAARLAAMSFLKKP